ncbi:hypothetical protein VTN31DRAFT_5157 [Thermomyces dupontii]|uniref:uncharacterized protein n=1 Tax=Talaromyces thermophilus TaxID=28565 RepID=UPI00374316DA
MPASVALRPPSMDTSFISSRNQRTVGGSDTQTTLPSVSSWGHDDDADSTDADSQSLLTPTDHGSTDGAGVFDDSDDQDDPLLASRGPTNRNSYHQDTLSFAAYRSSIHEDDSTSPKSRPISVCTVKRSSVVTCPAESLHKDKDDVTVPPSPMFLPPSWGAPDSTPVRTASMTSSVYSDDIADADNEVHEARRITFTSPTTRPHLVSVKTVWGKSSLKSGTPRRERSRKRSCTPERAPSVSNRTTRLSTMTVPPTLKEKTTPPVTGNKSKRHTAASVLRASSTKKLPHLSISVSRRSSGSTTASPSSPETPKVPATPSSQRKLTSRSSPSLQQQHPWPTRVSSRTSRTSDITTSSPTSPDQRRPSSRRASTRTTTSRTATPTQTPSPYYPSEPRSVTSFSPSPSLPPPTPPERPSASPTPATAKTFSLFPHVRTMSQASDWSTTTAPALYTTTTRTRTTTGTTTPDPTPEDAPQLVNRSASRKDSIAYLPRSLRGLRQNNQNTNNNTHSHHHHTSSSGISTISSLSSRSYMTTTTTPPSSPRPPRPPPPSISPTSSTHSNSNPRSIASNAAGLMKSKIMGLKLARKIMDAGS